MTCTDENTRLRRIQRKAIDYVSQALKILKLKANKIYEILINIKHTAKNSQNPHGVVHNLHRPIFQIF